MFHFTFFQWMGSEKRFISTVPPHWEQPRQFLKKKKRKKCPHQSRMLNIWLWLKNHIESHPLFNFNGLSHAFYRCRAVWSTPQGLRYVWNMWTRHGVTNSTVCIQMLSARSPWIWREVFLIPTLYVLEIFSSCKNSHWGTQSCSLWTTVVKAKRGSCCNLTWVKVTRNTELLP